MFNGWTNGCYRRLFTSLVYTHDLFLNVCDRFIEALLQASIVRCSDPPHHGVGFLCPKYLEIVVVERSLRSAKRGTVVSHEIRSLFFCWHLPDSERGAETRLSPQRKARRWPGTPVWDEIEIRAGSARGRNISQGKDWRKQNRRAPSQQPRQAHQVWKRRRVTRLVVTAVSSPVCSASVSRRISDMACALFPRNGNNWQAPSGATRSIAHATATAPRARVSWNFAIADNMAWRRGSSLSEPVGTIIYRANWIRCPPSACGRWKHGWKRTTQAA